MNILYLFRDIVHFFIFPPVMKILWSAKPLKKKISKKSSEELHPFTFIPSPFQSPYGVQIIFLLLVAKMPKDAKDTQIILHCFDLGCSRKIYMMIIMLLKGVQPSVMRAMQGSLMKLNCIVTLGKASQLIQEKCTADVMSFICIAVGVMDGEGHGCCEVLCLICLFYAETF